MKPLPIVAFVVAVAIGWLVAGNSARPAKPAPTATAAPVRDQRPERQLREKRGPDGIAGHRLAAIRASRDPAARMRATMDLANSLSPTEFADWMDGGWFAVSGGAELTLFTKIIEERWNNEDPEGFLVWAQKNGSGRAQSILASWAKTDPQRVLGFYKNHPNDSAEMRSLADVARTDPALALQRLQELAVSSSTGSNLDYYGREVLAVLVEKSPAALEAALDAMPKKLQLYTETALIGQRMKSSFDEEFRKLQERPDGLKIMKQILSGNLDSKDQESFQKSILADLAKLPQSWMDAIASNGSGFISYDNPEQWITADLEGAGFTEEQAKRLRSNALNNLYNQPEIALKLLKDVGLEDIYRDNLLGNIFRNLNGDADRAERLIAMLESEKDRELARGYLTPKTEDGKPKLDNPSDWLTSFAALDPENSNRYSFISATEDWDAGKSAELSRQFNALPDDSKRSVAKNLIATGSSNRTPLEPEAIRFLISHPDPAPSETESKDPFEPNSSNKIQEHANIQLASRYVGKLALTDPTAAGDWIATLPDGQPKLWAQKNLNSIWSTYDPAAAKEWFGTLPAATRENIDTLKTD